MKTLRNMLNLNDPALQKKATTFPLQINVEKACTLPEN